MELHSYLRLDRRKQYKRNAGASTSQCDQYGSTVHLFIGTGRSLCEITIMPLTFTIDLGIIYQGLDNLFPFKSVSFSTAEPKLFHEQLRHWFILLLNCALHNMYNFIPCPKVPVHILYLENMLVMFFRTFERRRPPTKPNANHVRARIRTHVHSDYIIGHHHTMLKVNSGKVL